jgi:putative oxidoreductase
MATKSMAMNSEIKFNISLLVIRVTVAFTMLSHGVQKLFGWFGGYGFEGTIGFFTDTIGLPYIVGLLIILTETIGMIFLLVGFLSRYFGIAVIVILLGAIWFHWPNGFYMNWSGTLPGEGYEFHVLLIVLALVPIINGGGSYSLDNVFFSGKNLAERKPSIV